MMLTKNQFKIMKVFVSKITELHTIRGVSRILKMNNSLAHRTIKPLIAMKLITITKEKLLTLNYKDNHDVLAYVEYLRRNDFLNKPKNKVLAVFIKDVIEKIHEDSFLLLIFGSAIAENKPRDIDILLILNDNEKIELGEKALYNIARNYTLKLDLQVISFESVYEMLATRDQKNVMNEVLDKHLIMYGAEIFYRLIKKGRK